MQGMILVHLQKAVCCLACARGGIGLLKSLISDSSHDPDHFPEEPIPEWCKCGRCRQMDMPI